MGITFLNGKLHKHISSKIQGSHCQPKALHLHKHISHKFQGSHFQSKARHLHKHMSHNKNQGSHLQPKEGQHNPQQGGKHARSHGTKYMVQVLKLKLFLANTQVTTKNNRHHQSSSIYIHLSQNHSNQKQGTCTNISLTKNPRFTFLQPKARQHNPQPRQHKGLI